MTKWKSSLVDPSLDKDQLTKEALKDAPALQKFMDKHCIASHYVFQERKCQDTSYYLCQDHPLECLLRTFKLTHLHTCHFRFLIPLRSTTIHLMSCLDNQSDQDHPSKGQPKDDQSADRTVYSIVTHGYVHA